MDRADEEVFVPIVWPGNADVAIASGRWVVTNLDTGQTILLGQQISGGGGFLPNLSGQDLRRYNRSLTRKLSSKCAMMGAFTLNRDFRPG